MTFSPLAYADSLRIGSVDFVSPAEIKVLLEGDAPDMVALNASTPHPFPRVNGYVLIPTDGGYLVGQIEWITVERSPFPKRRGAQDSGLIDLPYPLRKLSLNPLGMLRTEVTQKNHRVYRFCRGVDAFPSVGQPVLLPTTEQLRCIVESGDNRRVRIGTSPLAADADVSVDPNRLFGRHLAVLGNTGSGKSCSVAGLIRWSLEAAEDARNKGDGDGPNARFIVLDPNGEYGNTFDGLGDAVEIKRFSVDASEDDVEQLQVPLWFWNSEEWCAFTKAAPQAQRPLLRRALREMRLEDDIVYGDEDTHNELRFRRYLVSRSVSIRNHIQSGNIAEEATKFGRFLEVTLQDIENRANRLSSIDIDQLTIKISDPLESRHNSFQKNGETISYYQQFSEVDVLPIIDEMTGLIDALGGWLPLEGPSEDVPCRFEGADLADHIEILGEEENSSQYIDSLVTRIRTLLSDTRMKSIIETPDELTLDAWLAKYIGDDANKKASISIIDLSLVPTEVVHIITAVIARMTLEAQQRYRKQKGGKVLPTVMVMEEAHTFIKRYKDDAENQNNAQICCQVFEKIAREGRKFGLGLVLSSQRPSELSPTVLSQCNTFLLHRISNDRDQELVHKLVPDNLRGLLRDMPSLPARQAVLLGWAAALPTLVEIRHLPEAERPKSDDPDFWDVWTREAERDIDWQDIAATWQDGHSAENKPIDSDDSSKDLEEPSDPYSDEFF